MSTSCDAYLGKNPARYGRDIVRGLGIKQPPIDENLVADFLGYEIKAVGVEETLERPGLHKILQIACAHLFKKLNLIIVNRDMRRGRKRMSIFHEFGHDCIPWHRGFDFACSESAIEPVFHHLIEKEAFACGSEIMMPSHLFIPDVFSLPLGIDAIKELTSRYDASLEATAIRYAHTNPNICAIVMIEPAENQRPKAIVQDHTPPGQLLLPIRVPLRPLAVEDDKRDLLKVKYFVRSHRFPKYIAPGTGIEEDNPVFEAWATGRPVQEQIPASVFGSSAKWSYNAECVPLGQSGMVLVLLWLPDRHLKLDFKNGVIL